MSRLKFIILSILFLISAINLSGAVTLSVSPVSQTIGVGQEAEVKILVKDASGLTGFQFDLTYNGNILELQGAALPNEISANQLGPVVIDLKDGLRNVRIGAYIIGRSILLDNNSYSVVNIKFKTNRGGRSDLILSKGIFVGENTIKLSTIYENSFINVNRAPMAKISANPTQGYAPLTVRFKGSGSYDPDGDKLKYCWKFGDERTSSVPDPVYTYKVAGTYKTTLKVTDPYGASSESFITIVVKKVNTLPQIVYIHNYANLWIIWYGWDKEDRWGITYSYKIDNARWSSWSVTRSLYILSLRITPGWHTCYVKAKDCQGLESQIKSCRFYVKTKNK